MTMKALILTPTVLFRLTQFAIDRDWFQQFDLPTDVEGLRRVVVDQMVYIFETETCSDTGPLVVINLDPLQGIFCDNGTQVRVLERIITVAKSIYSESVVLPPNWRRHQEGSMISIQAPSRQRNWRSRIHFHTRPHGNGDLFAFSRLEEIVDFGDLDSFDSLYVEARNKYADAVLSPIEEKVGTDTRAGITLSHRLPQGFVQGATLDQWYDSKLTVEQRSFVDKPYDGPVRLRGAAGTGKTLSLVIKFLRDAMISEKAGKPLKLGFLTHSFASVDLVNSIGESLDSQGLLYGLGKSVKLEVRTLYDLAHQHLNFVLDELQPLSLDGREGRRLQFELIESALKEINGAPLAVLVHRGISAALHDKWKAVADGSDKHLVSEIMNEFASVLDAEGIRSGEEKGERYAKGGTTRASWLMSLPTEEDRRFILEVHKRYRKLLADMDTLSVDQMVGDFNSFLDSNRWDRIRARSGYDALFVDELHLFTSIERQILHKLIRQSFEQDGKVKRPPIFMAYDLKQSPRDTFTQYLEGDQNLFSVSTGLQNSELVKLERVFRYTPQIANFLADLDATFPAIDIPGEWDAYVSKAELADGHTPELTVYSDDTTLFHTVFKDAELVARSIDGGGRRVAVLCASEDQFDLYARAAEGQFRGRHLLIDSREPSSELRHAGKRFVFSMPEYVAGLQFDTVFLIHADAAEAALDAGDGIRRRFISNIYLGSSRAEKTLRLSASLAHGGRSDIFDMAIGRQSLLETAPAAARKGK